MFVTALQEIICSVMHCMFPHHIHVHIWLCSTEKSSRIFKSNLPNCHFSKNMVKCLRKLQVQKNKNNTSEMFSTHCDLSPSVQDDLND